MYNVSYIEDLYNAVVVDYTSAVEYAAVPLSGCGILNVKSQSVYHSLSIPDVVRGVLYTNTILHRKKTSVG